MSLQIIQVDQFLNMWNTHKLSTERNHSPQQILNFYMADATAPLPEIVDSDDEEEILPAEADELHRVHCDPIDCPLSAIKLLEFRQRVEPISLLVPFNELGRMFREGLHLMNEIFHRV